MKRARGFAALTRPLWEERRPLAFEGDPRAWRTRLGDLQHLWQVGQKVPTPEKQQASPGLGAQTRPLRGATSKTKRLLSLLPNSAFRIPLAAPVGKAP